MSTAQWTKPAGRPVPPMRHWSGLTDSRIQHRRNQSQAKFWRFNARQKACERRFHLYHVQQKTHRALELNKTRFCSVNQRPIQPCPSGHRESVCQDQEVGRTAPDQTARHRKGRCGVWSGRDRVLPDPPRQTAPPRGDGGSMSSALPRGSVTSCTAKSIQNLPTGLIKHHQLG